MERVIRHYKRRFVRYLEETLMNKVMALILIALGSMTLLIDPNDGGGLVCTLLFAIPLFFARQNHIG